MEANLKETAIESVAVPADESTRGFGPLKAVLSLVYADHKVRSRFFLPNIAFEQTIPQGTVVGNKIEDLLLRVVALEKSFDSRPNDVAEQRRRGEVIRYAVNIHAFLGLNLFQQARGL